MKKENILLKLLKLIGCVILGWFLWVIIISIVNPTEIQAEIDKHNSISMILGIISGIILNVILIFNKISRTKQKITESKSNIDVTNKRSLVLYEKANKVVDKYITHEGTVLTGIAEAKGKAIGPKNSKIKKASDFQNMIEQYPDLKANQNILVLLDQLKESENIIANFKITFNQMVSYYNSEINSFPAVIFKGLWKFKDEDFFKEEIYQDIVSDDELGI